MESEIAVWVVEVFEWQLVAFEKQEIVVLFRAVFYVELVVELAVRL